MLELIQKMYNGSLALTSKQVSAMSPRVVLFHQKVSPCPNITCPVGFSLVNMPRNNEY